MAGIASSSVRPMVKMAPSFTMCSHCLKVVTKIEGLRCSICTAHFCDACLKLGGRMLAKECCSKTVCTNCIRDCSACDSKLSVAPPCPCDPWQADVYNRRICASCMEEYEPGPAPPPLPV